jgi:beta-ribofuranosylaminobenzene 5'-phosphate synthase
MKELLLPEPDTAIAEREPAVRVVAPARLHLGFLDPGASLGRRFGSLGLTVNGLETAIELGAASGAQTVVGDGADPADIDRAAAWLHTMQRHTGQREPLRLTLVRSLAPHSGLGSGTQLALAIGRAFAQWHGLPLATPQIAQWLGRGKRSGIGIAGFDHGGLLVDGGPDANGLPGAVLARVALPATWRIVVVQDTACRGLSGHAEADAIAALPPLPRGAAADLCHHVLMRVLPGAAAADFASFAAGVTHIQRVLGAHFAAAQGGMFTSAAVGRLIEALGDHAVLVETSPAAIGQSSWGPTGFAFLPSQAHAEAVLAAAREAGLIAPSLGVRIVSGRNSGAAVIDRRAAPRGR